MIRRPPRSTQSRSSAASDVYKRQDVFGERVVVLERDLDGSPALPLLHRDRARVENFLVPVEMADERDEAAFEAEGALAICPFVGQADPEALVEVGGLPEPLGDRLEAVVRALEHLVVGTEARPRSPAVSLWPDLRDGRSRLAARILLGPDVAVARRLDAEPLGERVDHADADAMQAAGHLVAAALSLIHISEPTRLGMISYAVFCLKKKK